MKQEPKLKIKEAGNVIDRPINKEKILQMLSVMAEDIMFIRKQIENGSKNENQKQDIAKRLEEEEIMGEDDDLRRSNAERHPVHNSAFKDQTYKKKV